MRIALVNNMNNNMFALTRYLRDLGADAHLFASNEPWVHFHPQCDTFDDVRRLGYVHFLPFRSDGKQILNPLRARFGELLRGFDAIIACGSTMAFIAADGLRIDIAIPYGSDLYEIPFPKLRARRPAASVASAVLAFWQRRALQSARAVIADADYELFGQAARQLGLRPMPWLIPMLYVEPRVWTEPLRGAWTALEQRDLVVCNHSRQYWSSNLDALPGFDRYGGLKRNDRVIRAFARFLQGTRYRRPALVMFAYGPDVEASRRLVAELGIEGAVIWMPTSERRELLVGLRHATLVANAFREGYADLGGVTIEAMAMGVPVLNNVATIRDRPEHPFATAPIVQALTEDDLLAILRDQEARPEHYRQLGARGRDWFRDNLERSLARRYLELAQRAGGRKVDESAPARPRTE
jgi:glycosyltransferase involved in cell wall biosynthesis